MMDNVREDKRNMWLELKYISGRKEGKKVRREKVLNCKKTEEQKSEKIKEREWYGRKTIEKEWKKEREGKAMDKERKKEERERGGKTMNKERMKGRERERRKDTG